MRKFLIISSVIMSLQGPVLAGSVRNLQDIMKERNRRAALEFIADVMKKPEWKAWIWHLSGGADNAAANAGDCAAIDRIINRLDPSGAPRWRSIIKGESSRNYPHSCNPWIAQLSGGPGRGLTQQTIGWNDGAGGRVTQHWHDMYYEHGWNPNTDWDDVTKHMTVSIEHKNRYGWSAWQGY